MTLSLSRLRLPAGQSTPADPHPSVCIITSVHPVHDARIYHKQARTLAAAGFRVHLVGPDSAGAVLLPEESGDARITITRVRLPARRLVRMLTAPLILLRAVLSTGGRICHIHDPELLLLAFLLKLMARQVIYDVHEDYPRQLLSKHYLPKILRRPLAWVVARLEQIAGRVLDHVICATDAIAEHFPPPRTTIVRNYPHLPAGDPPPRPRLRNGFRAVHLAGTLTADRGITSLVQAMALLDDSCELLLAGRFLPESYRSCLESLPGWSRVRHIESVPHEQVWQIYAAADVGLVCSLPLPHYRVSLPVKLFEFMAAGLPVLVSDFPLFREIVRTGRCGLCVNPLEPAAIARALSFLRRHPQLAAALGRNGRRAIETRFNWNHEARKLLAVYRTLVPPSPRPKLRPRVSPVQNPSSTVFHSS